MLSTFFWHLQQFTVESKAKRKTTSQTNMLLLIFTHSLSRQFDATYLRSLFLRAASLWIHAVFLHQLPATAEKPATSNPQLLQCSPVQLRQWIVKNYVVYNIGYRNTKDMGNLARLPPLPQKNTMTWIAKKHHIIWKHCHSTNFIRPSLSYQITPHKDHIITVNVSSKF